MKRKIPLVTGQIYHIFSRSIANYKVLNDQADYLRMMQLLKYYQVETGQKFSDFITLKDVIKDSFDSYLVNAIKDKEKLVQIIAYCLMPTHLHIILKQLEDRGISSYCGKVLNSFSKFFNARHKRKGPLWEEKFKNVIVRSDEQLLHLTRYIHLNPVAAFLIAKPEQWPHSSYKEYLDISGELKLCEYEDLIRVDRSSYRKFVNDRISYQRELAKIKTLLMD